MTGARAVQRAAARASAVRGSDASGPWRPAPGPVVCIGETVAALAPVPPAFLLNAADL